MKLNDLTSQPSFFKKAGLIAGLILGLSACSSDEPMSTSKSLVLTGEDWWNIPDSTFATDYANQALGEDIEMQSKVAWMLFARVNQPVDYNGQTFTVWEMWPSNDETFSPAMGAFKMESKVRTRPHLQAPKIMRGMTHAQLLSFPPQGGGEEVTRNLLSYDYILGNGLNSKAGVWQYLSSTDPKVNFPIGTVEIKADWSDKPVAGAYQVTDPTSNVTYSLLGLHIMAKMAPTPNDAFYSEEPSWFWTTFEFKGNPGLANAQSLITYKDELPPADAQALLAQAGLSDTAFVNYVTNGTQIRYSDAQNPNIILGNTLMEDFAGVPDPKDPAGWTQWNSSCHTCHGTTSGNPKTQAFYPFTVTTGKITDDKINAYTPLDFVWSIAFHAR